MDGHCLACGTIDRSPLQLLYGVQEPDSPALIWRWIRRLFGSELCPPILCPWTIIQCRFFRGISDTIVVFLQGFCLILVCYCRVLAKPCMKSCRYPLWDCRWYFAATLATKPETKPAGFHTRSHTKNTESYKVQTKAYTRTDKHLWKADKKHTLN